MKNLNIKRVFTPVAAAIASVNKTFIYSFCAASLLLTSLLSIKALPGSNNGYDMANAYELPDMEFGVYEYHEQSHYNSDYPLVNNYGELGNDKWMKITVKDSGYLNIFCGSTSDDYFDTVLHLLDSSGSLITSNDDAGYSPTWLRSTIDHYVSAGDYYIILDGTNKNGHVMNAGVNISITLHQ